MKNYFELVKSILNEADEADENWAWYVVKCNEDSIEFRWGYLDYLEDDSNFILTIEDVEDDEKGVDVLIPSGSSAYVLVGDKFWDDCNTVEEGIKEAIFSAVRYAKKIY